MLSPDVVAFVRAALGPQPQRVLEVGAGDGALAAVLRETGHDVVAIDPGAEADGVRPVALLDLDEPAGSFDAAVAIVSLHHVEPLAESLAHLGALVRPGGTLVVDEIDVDALDERAARWWLAQRAALGDEDHEHHPHDPASLVADMRGHIHSLPAVREGLDEWFGLGEPVRGAYLHRWYLPLSLREAEVEQLAAGTLPAIGARLVGLRRA
jgi:SAM-dependent methyltransferase